ncbi:MAG TPA: flagellar hook-length control protein FliK [Xanthobacteraceae bacterium]|nr:flagellar hook-length control protein FliK [Xanthobacteraceae bacterium]
MDLIVSTPTVALNPQQGAAVPAFKPGDVIEAQVVQLIGDNAAKLAVGKLIMDVQTQVPLMVGATVRLAVKSTPDGIRLTLLGNGAGAPAGNAPSAAANPAAGASPTPDGAGSPPGAAGAASQQAATLVSTGTGSGAAPSAAAPLASASAGSGASTGTSTAVAAPSDPQLPPVPPPNPVAAATVALAAAVQNSAARQNGLAPLLADAEVATNLAGLPEPVRQATERLLALQPALDETTSAGSIRQALDRSGLFLEAHLSAAAGADPTQAAGRASVQPSGLPMPADDLKAALIVLRNVLKIWLGADAPRVLLPSTPAAGFLKPAAAPLDLGGAGAAADAGGKAEDMRPVGSAAPPPPYRGAPTAAQPAAAPSISPDMSPRDIGKVLLNETDAALARQTLLQAASLPSHAGAPGPVQHGASGPQWHFEVPFATPQGSTIAQFEIARDGHHAPAEGLKAVWRARFSLDIEPIGPVHAQIALTGTRAAVTLWAERPDTSAQLRDNAPQLAEALRQAELEPGDVLVRAGTPPRPREGAPAGRFLDRAS